MNMVLCLEDSSSFATVDGFERNRLLGFAETCVTKSLAKKVLLFDGCLLSEIRAGADAKELHSFEKPIAEPEAIAKLIGELTDKLGTKDLIVVADLKFKEHPAKEILEEYGVVVFKCIDSFVTGCTVRAIVYSRWATGDHLTMLQKEFRSNHVYQRDHKSTDELVQVVETLI